MTFSQLEQRINNNKEIDFGDIFSKSFELFKKTWTKGLVLILLSLVVGICVAAVALLPMFFLGLFDPYQFQHEEPSILMMITMLVTMLPAIFLASAFTMLINAAFF